MKWIGRKQSSPTPVQPPASGCQFTLPEQALEAEVEVEAMAFLAALHDSINGTIKDRDQIAKFCHESFTILQATSRQPLTNDFKAFCALCEPAYVAMYLERVQRYQDSPQTLRSDKRELASHGLLFSLAAARHVFMKRKKEEAHVR